MCGWCDKSIRAPRVWMPYERSATLAAAITKLRPVHIQCQLVLSSPLVTTRRQPTPFHHIIFADDRPLFSHLSLMPTSHITILRLQGNAGSNPKHDTRNRIGQAQAVRRSAAQEHRPLVQRNPWKSKSHTVTLYRQLKTATPT